LIKVHEVITIDNDIRDEQQTLNWFTYLITYSSFLPKNIVKFFKHFMKYFMPKTFLNFHNTVNRSPISVFKTICGCTEIPG